MCVKTCFFLFFVFAFLQKSFAQDLSAVMGAMPEEVAALKERMQQRREVLVEGIRFWTGRLQNKPVVLVQSGVGKVNAAMTTTLLLQHFKPARVLFTGVAGGIGRGVHIGDIVVADSVVQHDFGTLTKENSIARWGAQNPVNDRRNPIYFKPDSFLRSLALTALPEEALAPVAIGTTSRKPVVLHGVIATGDQFISSSQKKAELSEHLQAQAVEMEGAAVAQVCYQKGVPFLIIRSISDLAEEDARFSFDAFMKTAAENSASVVSGILRLLPQSGDVQDSSYTKTELFFGMESRGKLLTETQWQNFLRQTVTPRFPDGFTVVNSYGQWLGAKTKKVRKEPSRMVVILHRNDEASEEAITAIIAVYRQQFKQEAVLRVDTKTNRVAF